MGLSKGVRYMIVSGWFFMGMQVCIKMLDRIPAWEIVFFRSFFILVFSFAFLKIRRIPWSGNGRKWLLLRGLFGTIALVMFFTTLKVMPLASAITIQHLTPIFSGLLATVFLGEKTTTRQWFFFALSFLGVLIIKGFDPRVEWWSIGLGVGAALFASMAYNAVRKLKESDHPMVVVFYFPLVATPITGLFSVFNWVMPIGMEWLYIGLMGCSTLVAQYTLTASIQSQELSQVSYVKYLTSVYALLIGYFVFDETFGWKALGGMALILIGVLLNLFYRQWQKSALRAFLFRQ